MVARVRELRRSDAGDDDPAGGDGTLEDRAGIREVVCGGTGCCGHVAIMLDQTVHLVTGLM